MTGAYYGGLISNAGPRRSSITCRRTSPTICSPTRWPPSNEAEKPRRPRHPDAILRWNACVRLLAAHPQLAPKASDEPGGEGYAGTSRRFGARAPLTSPWHGRRLSTPRSRLRRHRGRRALEAPAPRRPRRGVRHRIGHRACRRSAALGGVLFGQLGAAPEAKAVLPGAPGRPGAQRAAALERARRWRLPGALLAGGHAPGMRQYLGSALLQERVAAFWANAATGRPPSATVSSSSRGLTTPPRDGRSSAAARRRASPSTSSAPRTF